MAEVSRVSPEEARRKVTAGRALLVCAYEDEARCGQMMLDGGLSMAGLQARLGSLPRDQELIFYCA